MTNLSTAAKYYLAFCLATCGYFTMAAVGGWGNPVAHSGSFAGPSGSHGHSYSSGGYSSSSSYSGRSSGGFGGGGK